MKRFVVAARILPLVVFCLPGLAPASEPEPSSEPRPDAVRDVPRGFSILDGSYFWVDSGVMSRENEQAGQYNAVVNYMGGRLVLAPSYYGEVGTFFGLAKAEFVALESINSKFQPDVQDAFVQFGQRSWDLQVGRFLAWEVYHRGKGIELYTAEEAGALNAPPLYWMTNVRGHANEAGQAAFHLYPFDFVGLEIASIYGQESNQNNLGLRPALDVQLGSLRLLAGYEYFRQLAQTEADKVDVTSRGYAGSAIYSLPLAGQRFGKGRVFPRAPNPLDLPQRDALTIGVGAAHESVDYIDIQGLVDGARTKETTTVGAFLDLDFWKNAFSLGFHRTIMKNREGETHTHNQAFIAYLFRLPVEGLVAKAVYGYAVGNIEDIDNNSRFVNGMHSLRLRLAYAFH
jgi:hypothetical protein